MEPIGWRLWVSTTTSAKIDSRIGWYADQATFQDFAGGEHDAAGFAQTRRRKKPSLRQLNDMSIGEQKLSSPCEATTKAVPVP